MGTIARRRLAVEVMLAAICCGATGTANAAAALTYAHEALQSAWLVGATADVDTVGVASHGRAVVSVVHAGPLEFADSDDVEGAVSPKASAARANTEYERLVAVARIVWTSGRELTPVILGWGAAAIGACLGIGLVVAHLVLAPASSRRRSWWWVPAGVLGLAVAAVLGAAFARLIEAWPVVAILLRATRF